MTPNLVARTNSALAAPLGVRFSPLVLADRLISLAQAAERAGYENSATRLIALAYAVLDDEQPITDAAAA